MCMALFKFKHRRAPLHWLKRGRVPPAQTGTARHQQLACMQALQSAQKQCPHGLPRMITSHANLKFHPPARDTLGVCGQHGVHPPGSSTTV